MADGPAWQYSGELILACSCDWGCPCNFGRRPTQGFCHGGYAINILNGAHSDTPLDGLRFAWFAKWPGQIHEGAGTAGIYIDQRATQEQRAALEQILTGKAGGLPWIILAASIDHWLPAKYVEIEWKSEGVHSSFKAGPYVHATLEPMRNPVTGAESAARVVLPKGFVMKEGEIASSRSFAVFDTGMKYAYPGKNCSVARVNHPTA